MSESKSYHRILRSSSIIGGAQAINYAVGLVRVKIVAVLLGPVGVGLVGLYQSAIGTVGSATGFGIGSSGVREVSAAYGQGDSDEAARVIHILRRTCWATGLIGWLVTLAFAVPLSRVMTGTPNHAWAIALLGGTLLVGAINAGQMAVIQGTRRIGDIARIDVWSTLATTVLAAALYAWLGMRGIVPVLLGASLIALALSHHYARKVPVSPVHMSWRQLLRGASPLMKLGAAFTLSALLTAGLDLFTRTLISRKLGLDATGIYQAAWALSGTFAAFVLKAMGTDFYPRLTGVIQDHEQATNEVNQQTEIGILLALPGLVATIAFAPWVIRLLYTHAFAPAAVVLTWMVLGVFGRVISWPMGFIMLALGAARWYAATEFVFIGIWAALVLWMVPAFGVIGAAYAFGSTYLVYTIGMLWTSQRLIRFQWSRAVWRLLAASTLLVAASMLCALVVPRPWNLALGGAVCVAAALLSSHGLASRLGPEHAIVRMLSRIPGHRWIIGKQ